MTRGVIYWFLLMVLLPVLSFCGTLQELSLKFGKDIKESGHKIAVMDFSTINNSQDSTTVRERVTTFLAQNKNITLIERSLLEKVLQEQKIQVSGVVGSDTAKKIGELIGADAVVSGTLTELSSDEIELNARVIEVRTGKVISAGQAVFKRDWKHFKSFNVFEQNGKKTVPYEFRISDLPGIPSASAPVIDGGFVPRMQMSPQLFSEQSGLDFGSLDMDVLEKYNEAVKFDKSSALPFDKYTYWKKLGKKVSVYAETASKRAGEWLKFAEASEMAEAMEIDKSTASPEDKAGNWNKIAERYPAKRSDAKERSTQWKRYAAELAAIAKAKGKRLALAKKDYDKLKRLLAFSVVSEQDKQRFAVAFVDAYGKSYDWNPYITKLADYLPVGYLSQRDKDLNDLIISKLPTTTDNKTGLMWVKDGKSAGCNNGGRLSWPLAFDFCDDLIYAEYSDWRLPTPAELKSIVVKGNSPTINTTLFPNTKEEEYWTSLYTADGMGWSVHFYTGGETRGNGYSYRHNVRCVRTDQ